MKNKMTKDCSEIYEILFLPLLLVIISLQFTFITINKLFCLQTNFITNNHLKTNINSANILKNSSGQETNWFSNIIYYLTVNNDTSNPVEIFFRWFYYVASITIPFIALYALKQINEAKLSRQHSELNTLNEMINNSKRILNAIFLLEKNINEQILNEFEKDLKEFKGNIALKLYLKDQYNNFVAYKKNFSPQQEKVSLLIKQHFHEHYFASDHINEYIISIFDVIRYIDDFKEPVQNRFSHKLSSLLTEYEIFWICINRNKLSKSQTMKNLCENFLNVYDTTYFYYDRDIHEFISDTM